MSSNNGSKGSKTSDRSSPYLSKSERLTRDSNSAERARRDRTPPFKKGPSPESKNSKA